MRSRALAKRMNAEAKASGANRKASSLQRKPPTGKPAGPRVRREHPRAGSRYEAELARRIELEGIEAPELQHRFAASLGREFRFDFAWPRRKLAVEVDGGRWLVRRGKDGRPVPVGFHNHIEDYRKLNLAARLGWRVMRFLPEQVRSGEATQEIKLVLQALATPCANCGKPVEPARECYATPTCYACLPPPSIPRATAASLGLKP